MSEASRPFRVLLTRRAEKDLATLSQKMRRKLRDILVNRLAVDPHGGKKLMGELKGYFSVRLSLHDRIVYRIDEAERLVYIIRARTHFGK